MEKEVEKESSIEANLDLVSTPSVSASASVISEQHPVHEIPESSTDREPKSKTSGTPSVDSDKEKGSVKSARSK